MPSRDRVEIQSSPKRIAIIGGGASGAVVADALLKEQAFDSITIFEKTPDWGGVWVLNESVQDRSTDVKLENDTNLVLESPFDKGQTGKISVPKSTEYRFDETPSYEGMTTNITEKLMTYSDVDYWGQDKNFVERGYVQKYIHQYIERNRDQVNLVNSTTVETVDKIGNEYVLTLRQSKGDQDVWFQESFDSIVVASGHYSVPFIPEVPGLSELRSKYPDVVKHSKYFRDPSPYKDKTIVVVGSRASGYDLVKFVGDIAKSIVQSVRTDSPKRLLLRDNLVIRPEIQEILFEDDDFIVRFVDGTTVRNPDHIIYGTGYKFSFPFLDKLFPNITNGRILPSLFQHTINILDPLVNFVGIPIDGLSFRVFEYQAIIIARFLAGRISLPPIDKQVEWTEERYKLKGNTRAYHTIGLTDVVEYYDQLREIGKTDKVVGREFPSLEQKQVDAYAVELQEIANKWYTR